MILPPPSQVSLAELLNKQIARRLSIQEQTTASSPATPTASSFTSASAGPGANKSTASGTGASTTVTSASRSRRRGSASATVAAVPTTLRLSASFSAVERLSRWTRIGATTNTSVIASPTPQRSRRFARRRCGIGNVQPQMLGRPPRDPRARDRSRRSNDLRPRSPTQGGLPPLRVLRLKHYS
jgi:hypothetical protein